jgi:hypothetical protein
MVRHYNSTRHKNFIHYALRSVTILLLTPLILAGYIITLPSRCRSLAFFRQEISGGKLALARVRGVCRCDRQQRAGEQPRATSHFKVFRQTCRRVVLESKPL